MHLIYTLGLVFLVTLAFDKVCCQQQVGASSIDNSCIGCICEAASKCDRTAGCLHGMCGLFRFTFPYWVDAGKPVISGDNPDDKEAWVRCSSDPPCAAETVVNYLTKYRKDCNGDGVIDCVDYAWIHHLGGFGCGSRPLDSLYERQLRQCLTSSSPPSL